MKKTVLAAVLLIFGTLAFAQGRIAVFPFEDLDDVLSRTEALLLYREFVNEFTNRSVGRFNVISKQDVEKYVNPELAFRMRDFSLRIKSAEMSRVFNGAQILSGSIGKVGERISIQVFLYSYPDMKLLPGGTSLRVANVLELFDKIPSIVESMQVTVGSGGTVSTISGTASGAYKIGDTGPGGGIIFFDRGFVRDGWRYLEAAPVRTEFTASWGAYGKDVTQTVTGVGFGKQNTENIVNYLKSLRENNKAAQLCDSLTVNGYGDWFLPSKDELDLMYKNLKQRGLGDFSNNYYWSSSQYFSYNSWYQNFHDGSQSVNYYKGNSLLVRAIRAF